MNDPQFPPEMARAMANDIRALCSQTDLLLRTMQQQIWNRDRYSPLAREAESFLRTLMQDARYANHRRLEHYGFKVFSQNGEDGIIQEIFNRIGTKSRRFIEFGVQTGHQCNTHLLLYLGWSGLWIEGDPTMFAGLNDGFEEAIRAGVLTAKQCFLTVENINDVFSEAGVAGEIDLLSVDVDGNDWHLCRALEVVSPRVIVVEYNASFPPPIHWIMPYSRDFRSESSLYFGASLTAFCKMLEKNYALVGTDICGINAFFVRNDEAGDRFAQLGDAVSLYNPPRYGLGMGFPTGHPVPRRWRPPASA